MNSTKYSQLPDHFLNRARPPRDTYMGPTASYQEMTDPFLAGGPVLYDHAGAVPQADRTLHKRKPEGISYATVPQRALRSDFLHYPRPHGMWYHKDKPIYTEHPFFHKLESGIHHLEGDIKEKVVPALERDAIDELLHKY